MINGKQELIGKYDHAVSALLREREDVLVSFCEILALDMEHMGDLGHYLQKFSQLLTDYSALGHFEVIEPLLGEGAQPNKMELSARIRETTDFILRFSDSFSPQEVAAHNLAELSGDLDALGEKLAERFEMEDDIIRLATS